MAKYISEPKAVVLADSISPAGHRLTTMEVTMHRFVLAEFNTHRVFSRNSASSRAIPGRLQRERVLTGPAEPISFPAKQRGMQGGEELSENLTARAGMLWRKAALQAATTASQLDQMGVHKSVTNRLLEPFLFQTVIVTSTEWDGFFAQRASELAQPEIRVPAELMLEAYEESTPQEIEEYYWHLPLLTAEDYDDMKEYVAQRAGERGWLIYSAEMEEAAVVELEKQVSAARCARVSYLTHDGKRDIEKDLELYKRLVTADPPHWSPLEHVATPCECGYSAEWNNDPFGADDRHKGNFRGWDQLRHTV